MINNIIFCPICSSESNISMNNKLFFCKNCDVVFNPAYKTINYDKNYFTDDYKDQYGRTYIEDFDNIYIKSKMRLHKILKLLNKKTNLKSIKLLDIGSALGFFLKCAQDSGIENLMGVEISEYASRYTSDKLKINVKQDSFVDIDIKESYDIITAWYFIEHCFEPMDVMKKIFNCLNRGGIFALSTPSIFGPSYLFNKDKWVLDHPHDHRIDFSPKSIKKILKRIGFTKIYIQPAGYHPERIISRSSFIFKPFSFIFRHLAKLINFSDTMEVYALK